jgi:molybdopterin-guanine dinucleotide biosynthesis protein A
MGQIELFCVSSNQNQTPSLGLRKLDPEKGGKQGELAGTCTCLKCIPKDWLVVWPTREVMTRSHTLSVVWDLGLANLSVVSRTLISKPFS